MAELGVRMIVKMQTLLRATENIKLWRDFVSPHPEGWQGRSESYRKLQISTLNFKSLPFNEKWIYKFIWYGFLTEKL